MPPETAAAIKTVRNIAIIRQHLEIAEVSKRTQALMPSIVNFKDAMLRLTAIETELATLRANVFDLNTIPIGYEFVSLTATDDGELECVLRPSAQPADADVGFGETPKGALAAAVERVK